MPKGKSSKEFLEQLMETAVQQAVAQNSVKCLKHVMYPEGLQMEVCADHYCANCGGSGRIVPHRYSPIVAMSLFIETFLAMEHFRCEGDPESISHIIGWGARYAKRAQANSWEDEMQRRLAMGETLHDIADDIEENGALGPDPESSTKIADAIRECDGTFEDFKRIRKKRLGW